MILQALWVCLVLILQLRTVSMFTISFDEESKETVGKDNHLNIINSAKKMDELFNPKDLPQSSTVPHRKAPQFMLDLFNAVADSNGIPGNQDKLEGNVVRSFGDRGHGGRFNLFNLSSFGRDERMIKTEFRWFRQKQRLFFGKSYGPHFYKVDLYEVLDSRVKPWRGNLITSRLLPLYTQGWEVFNVTQTVSKWIHRIRNSEENNGIQVVITLATRKRIESVLPSSERQGKSPEENAYLVIFSDDRRCSTTNRSLNQGHVGHATTPDSPAKVLPQNNRRKRAAPSYPRSRPMSCQRIPLFVDFEEIGWAGWIISPRGYNAYHCKGSCPFPLGESLRPTNHATVQSVMHALKLSNEVDTPCCVPDKLQSISLLYFDDEENVVLKQYDDMVAVSCGCH